MRIDYMAGTFHFDGPKLMGRSLVRHLNQEHQVSVLGALVQPDSDLLNGPNAEHCLIETDLDSEVVFLEGGWVEGHGFTRARPEFLAEFARAGGIVVIADLDRNKAENGRDSLETVGGPWPAPRYGLGVRYLHDEGARDFSNTQRFFTSQMRITDWLEPAMRGIDSLLVWGPVELEAKDAIAASGHSTTRILVRDLFADEGFHWPWASVREYGKGFIVVIGASITGDVYVEACPDNARWISNLLALLSDRVHENKSWGGAAATGGTGQSDGSGGAAQRLTQLLEVEESETHERKSSFLTPIKAHEATPQIKIQLAVLKAIAALANTDGGHLIIGQDDHGTPLGLAADFSRLPGTNQTRDGFALLLSQFVDQRLSRSWLQLGLVLEWVDMDEIDIAVVRVPRSTKPVWASLDDKRGEPDTVVVRSGPRTLTLKGPHLGEWIETRA